MSINIYKELETINNRPMPFEHYTASDLWTDEHTSQKMLECHLNEHLDMSSRNHAFIDRSAAWITSHFNLGTGSRVIDFGCGPGLYTSRLARTGAQVTGVDFSGRSIEYARNAAQAAGHAIEYVKADYLAYEPAAAFDLAMMIMCDYCALSPGQRQVMLKKFRSLLKPGGCVLLDAYLPGAYTRRDECATYGPNLLNGFWSSMPYYGFLNTFKYDDVQVVLDKYTIIEEQRTRTVYNWLQYFSPDKIAAEFADAGLSVAAQYANVAGDRFDPEADEFAVVGRPI